VVLYIPDLLTADQVEASGLLLGTYSQYFKKKSLILLNSAFELEILSSTSYASLSINPLRLRAQLEVLALVDLPPPNKVTLSI
jgi:hypothetical protein